MNNKTILILSIVLVTLAAGVWLLTQNQNPGQIVDENTFTLKTSGSSINYLNKVNLTIPNGAVREETRIRITETTNPTNSTDIVMLSTYEFTPSGLSFDQPAKLSIHYNSSEIPENLDESDLRIYVFEDDEWVEAEGSTVDVDKHVVSAPILHFSKMGSGGSSSGGGGGGIGVGDWEEVEDGYATIWFKADLYFYDHKTFRVRDTEDRDTYAAGVSAYWDPVPYVQYYQIKFEYKTNPPTTAYGWGTDWHEQNEPWCHKTVYHLQQGFIYRLGGDPNREGYLSLFDASEVATISYVDKDTGEFKHGVYGRLRPAGSHGFAFLGVHDTIKDSDDLSALEKQVRVGNMRTFVSGYVDGWEIWVRGVTEQKPG